MTAEEAKEYGLIDEIVVSRRAAEEAEKAKSKDK